MKDRENALVKSKNRVVLITGSSGGIGRATARAFASAGFDIALHGWRHLKRLEPLAEEIGRMGVRSVIVRADVSERSQVFEMFDKVRDQLGMVDVLVNNAGIAQQKCSPTSPRMTGAKWSVWICPDRFIAVRPPCRI